CRRSTHRAHWRRLHSVRFLPYTGRPVRHRDTRRYTGRATFRSDIHMPKSWLKLLLLPLATSAWGTDQYLIIGGGPTPDASQVSIEQNVLWIDSVLQQFPFSKSRVVFGAGKDGALDVVFHAP